jgi:hypothetical protein
MILQSRVQLQQRDQCGTQKQMWPVKDALPHNNRTDFVIAKDGDMARERAMRCIALPSKRLSASINNTALHIILNKYASTMHSPGSSSVDQRYSTT